MNIKYIVMSLVIVFPLSLSATESNWGQTNGQKSKDAQHFNANPKLKKAKKVDSEVAAMTAALGLPTRAFTVGTPAQKKAKIAAVAKRHGLTRSARSGAQIDHRMVFSTGSAMLNRNTKRRVGVLAKVYKGNPNMIKRIIVGGFTDTVGDANENRILSEKRANSVKQELIAQGVPHWKILARGYGEWQTLPGMPGTAAANRRVEYSVSR